MWYAIEYAYGAHVVNNGNRADRVVEFSARRLRDAWVAAGAYSTTSPGYREIISARHPAVRKAHGLQDGDGEAWRAIAEQRVNDSAMLRKHRAIICYDWTEADHWKWVATAPEREIVSWAKETEQNAYEIEQVVYRDDATGAPRRERERRD